jgi:hypothetical protein
LCSSLHGSHAPSIFAFSSAEMSSSLVQHPLHSQISISHGFLSSRHIPRKHRYNYSKKQLSSQERNICPQFLFHFREYLCKACG